MTEHLPSVRACTADHYDGPPPGSPLHPDVMPMGWPRPLAWWGDRHLPVPYIATSGDDLGNVEALRQALCVVDHRCQVCGLELGDECIVVAGPGNVLVIDGAGICPTPCWPVARRKCPTLAALIAVGTLRVWTIRTELLVVDGGWETPGYLVPNVEPDA